MLSFRRACLFAFVAVWLINLGEVLFGARSAHAWPQVLLLVIVTSATLLWMAASLPWQNVIAGSVLLMGFWATLGGFAISGYPGPEVIYLPPTAGSKDLPRAPWSIAWIWTLLVFNGRGVARLVLRPWGNAPNYGLWLVGLTGLLVLAFDICLQPVAALLGLWNWSDPPSRPGLLAPWTHFAGCLLATWLALLMATPWLIHKKPVPEPTLWDPLLLWTALHATMLLGNLVQGVWWAVAFGLSISALNVLLAILPSRGLTAQSPRPFPGPWDR